MIRDPEKVNEIIGTNNNLALVLQFYTNGVCRVFHDIRVGKSSAITRNAARWEARRGKISGRLFFCITIELALKPCLGQPKIVADDVDGLSKHLGCFPGCHTTEISHFNQSRQQFVFLRQCYDRTVQ